MFNYISEDHQRNIHISAFGDIANVFLELKSEYDSQLKQLINKEEINDNVQWVCNASMGHGKTTALKCFLKHLVSEGNSKRRIPVLLVIREKGMAEEIFEEMQEFNSGCVLLVNSENKKEVEPYVPYHQIVIITHSRLDNLTLGYGNLNTYKMWQQYRDGWSIHRKLDPKNLISKRYRLLIIDEKPSFVNGSIFDIGSKNNTLDWFDDLVSPLELNPYETQTYKSEIIKLIAHQLAINTSSVTTSLIPENENSIFLKNLKRNLKKMKENEFNKPKISSLKQLRHFEKLLKKDGAGRIDDYQIKGQSGRKIIISEKIDYSKLKLNTLILDGTAQLTWQQYSGLFIPKIVKNYNDYRRLNFNIENINTSKYSRSKIGNTTQKAISNRILELKQIHTDMFVLPVKSDIPIYKNEGAIGKDISFFEQEKSNGEAKPINLLNTTGKNELKDRKSLFLTSLPKMNADYYKMIAIALYGNDISLNMSNDNLSDNWFDDEKLQSVYMGEMFAEICQIIHRTALRKINSKDTIDIYIAYDDEDNEKIMSKPNGAKTLLLSETLNVRYFNRQANIKHHSVVDESLYGRGNKVRQFAEEIDRWIRLNITVYNDLPRRVGEIDKEGELGKKFRQWLKRNWTDEKIEMINNVFAEYGLVIEERKDEYSDKSKYINKMNDTYFEELFG
ncbi:hypothetical protein [Lederbergia citri]|uniref:Uncharacterized protein n=1 Tax=Lederbergia citri TaxID=2833580 RepID=A0A942YF63_9BACI|nr:hypothetical protein [Lederbergia citri]MBS4194673.1 hypothetical protein [Lederbergia citri]